MVCAELERRRRRIAGGGPSDPAPRGAHAAPRCAFTWPAQSTIPAPTRRAEGVSMCVCGGHIRPSCASFPCFLRLSSPVSSPGRQARQVLTSRPSRLTKLKAPEKNPMPPPPPPPPPPGSGGAAPAGGARRRGRRGCAKSRHRRRLPSAPPGARPSLCCVKPHRHAPPHYSPAPLLQPPPAPPFPPRTGGRGT